VSGMHEEEEGDEHMPDRSDLKSVSVRRAPGGVCRSPLGRRRRRDRLAPKSRHSRRLGTPMRKPLLPLVIDEESFRQLR